ncbi:MAG: glycosyltransferase [Burkholderiales bacterium]
MSRGAQRAGRRARRFLLVAAPFAAHLVPLVSIGRELAARGHAVAWVAYPPLASLLPGDATWFPGPAEAAARTIAERGRRRPPRFGAAEVVWFYSDIVAPLVDVMTADVEAAVARFAPDVVVADQHALAGAFVARLRGLPWATSAPTSLAQIEPADEHPAVRRWLGAWYADVQRAAGMAPLVDTPDLSPSLVLLYTSRLLAGAHRVFPPAFRFVGPALAHRVEPADFPWAALADRPRVLVSLGSIVAEDARRFFSALVAALRDEPVQVVVSAPEGALAGAPANFLVRPWLPQVALMPHVHAVVSHGGSTALDALAFDRPLVLAPVWTDNFVTAQRIVDAGAGLRVRYGRIGPERLREAVRAVLTEPEYRAHAAEVGTSLRAAGGTVAAADLVAALA